VEGDLRLRVGEAELRIPDDLVAGERDEGRVGPVTRASHVLAVPLLVAGKGLVLLARDVG
jgi:hypothetical protein